MNLIRTVIETILRPCGGTLLIKSNRYLCFEAGKGEAQIAGRQTVKQLRLRNTFKHLKPDLFETTIQYNPNNPNPVATNRIPIHINNVIQAIEAAKKAFDTINANMLSAKDAYSDAYSKYHAAATALTNQYVNTIPQDFASLYPNNIDSFNAVQMQNKPQPHKLYALERYKEIKTYVNVLNENALYIKDMHLTSDKIWADFKNVYLQDTVVSQLINTQIIETSLKNLFDNSTTQNYLSNNGPQDLGVNLKRALVYEILNLLINNQTTTETQDSTHCSVNKISLGQQIQAYDNTQWGNLINNNLAYENGAPDQLRKRDNARLGIMKSKFLGLHKLDGMLDQYIWDTNEDAGKILFSDQEGETLNFQNKEIHYYKKSETDPLAKLKQILRSIQ